MDTYISILKHKHTLLTPPHLHWQPTLTQGEHPVRRVKWPWTGFTKLVSLIVSNHALHLRGTNTKTVDKDPLHTQDLQITDEPKTQDKIPEWQEKSIHPRLNRWHIFSLPHWVTQVGISITPHTAQPADVDQLDLFSKQSLLRIFESRAETVTLYTLSLLVKTKVFPTGARWFCPGFTYKLAPPSPPPQPKTKNRRASFQVERRRSTRPSEVVCTHTQKTFPPCVSRPVLCVSRQSVCVCDAFSRRRRLRS